MRLQCFFVAFDRLFHAVLQMCLGVHFVERSAVRAPEQVYFRERVRREMILVRLQAGLKHMKFVETTDKVSYDFTSIR